MEVDETHHLDDVVTDFCQYSWLHFKKSHQYDSYGLEWLISSKP